MAAKDEDESARTTKAGSANLPDREAAAERPSAPVTASGEAAGMSTGNEGEVPLPDGKGPVLEDRPRPSED